MLSSTGIEQLVDRLRDVMSLLLVGFISASSFAIRSTSKRKKKERKKLPKRFNPTVQ